MSLDLSKPVQTRDGRKVRILCTDAGGERPVVGLIDGCVWRWTGGGYDSNGNYRSAQYDLVNVPEPERTVWVNVYVSKSGKLHCGKPQASEANALTCPNFSGTMVARAVPLTYRPGQGID